MKQRGFSLVELLVVVLIISILVAIALPQYQKAVEKSRAMQAITLLQSVYQAAERYYLENGEWPMTFNQLDIAIPWTGHEPYYAVGQYREPLSNADWAIQIVAVPSQQGILVGRISGPWKGGAFYMWHKHSISKIPLSQIVCSESNDDDVYVRASFAKASGNYCRGIFKGVELTGLPTGSARYYKM